MDLGWFKNYYKLKCEAIKNHEGQQNYAILIKKSVQSIPCETMYYLGDRGFNYKFYITPPTPPISISCPHLSPPTPHPPPPTPHSWLRMLYLFNISPKLSNIPGHQVNTNQHLPLIYQLRTSRSDIIIWINWVLLNTTCPLSYISSLALNELENY